MLKQTHIHKHKILAMYKTLWDIIDLGRSVVSSWQLGKSCYIWKWTEPVAWYITWDATV